MSQTVVIYHNPRCSKSRQALEVVQARAGEQLEVVRYLEQPLSQSVLKRLLGALKAGTPGFEAHDLLRTREAPYAALGLSKSSTQAQILAAIAQHPVLLERPVIAVGERAVIGRPTERVNELFD